MFVSLKNVHRVVAKGKVYHYHRPTGERLKDAPGSPAFIARVNALNNLKKPPRVAAATLGGLLRAYRASPEYTALAKNTKRNYDRTMRVLDGFADMPLDDVTGPFVIRLRDKLYTSHSLFQANHSVMMLRTLWAWGKPRGITSGDPTDGIKDIPRPKGKPPVNRRWKPAEILAFLDHCWRPDVSLAVVIAANTGLRSCDIVALRWEHYDGEVIDTRQIKTGDEAFVPCTPVLRAALDAVARVSDYIVPNGTAPHKDSNFTSLFGSIKEKLEAEGKIPAGLTFHGLRHTVGSELADAGADNRTIMAVTGHRSERTVSTYTRDAERKRNAKRGAEMLAAVKLGVKPEKNEGKSAG